MNTPASRADGAVTVLVSRRVRPGHLPGFTRSMDALLRTAAAFPGHMGAKLILPPDTAGDTFAHAVVAFRDAASLFAWQDSEERARALDAVSMHVVGASQTSLVPGLERWFAAPGTAQPARWKVALLTWAGLCPTVYLETIALSAPLEHWPTLPRVMLITAVSVVLMAWTIVPTLNRRFARWLRAEAAPHQPPPLEPSP